MRSRFAVIFYTWRNISKHLPTLTRNIFYRNNLCFSGCATITGTQYPSRVAIALLQDVYSDFSSKYGDAAKTAAENSLSKKAKSILQDVCKKYEDPSSVDKTQKILGQVDAVKGQMQDNIASMLKNTEKAEDMAAKSEQLNEQASVFKKRSTDLKKQMQWTKLIILSLN